MLENMAAKKTIEFSSQNNSIIKNKDITNLQVPSTDRLVKGILEAAKRPCDIPNNKKEGLTVVHLNALHYHLLKHSPS